MASFNLSLYKQALLFCTECAKAVIADPEIKVFQTEKDDYFKLISLVDDKFAEFYKKVLEKYVEFEEEKKRTEKIKLKQDKMDSEKEGKALDYLKLNGVKLEQNLFEIPKSQTVNFYLKENVLHTSCLFVYDQVNISDYIQDFDYSTSISDHLDAMFGSDGQFNSKNSLCFYQVTPDEVLKFDMYSPFQDVAFKSKTAFKVPVVHIVTDEHALDSFHKI